MFRVTCEIHFCFGHRLMNYPGRCANLHGHNGKAVVSIQAEELDSLGMVTDFTLVKRVMRQWIDETLDHKMLLHQDDPMTQELKRLGMPVVEMDVNPTTENIAKLIYDNGRNLGLEITEVVMWETVNSYATYRGSNVPVEIYDAEPEYA
jgi:6-pyruvoyltetrahydropterin/6-carboxytetrahydropterin synthase